MFSQVFVCPPGGEGLSPYPGWSLPGLVSVQGVPVQASVQGVTIQGGGSLSRRWGSLSWRPPYENQRAICILLECILVSQEICRTQPVTSLR